MFAKSLFIEFIYLQPVIFFTALFFAFYSFHNFLYRQKLHISDMVFSSWFIFGVFFLSLLKYHPSRYYLILVVPLSILAARFFTFAQKADLSQLVVQEKVLSFRRVIAAGLKFYFIFNLGVSIFMLVFPLRIKKGIYDDLYFKIINHRFLEAIPTVLFLLCWQILIFAVTLPLMGHLYRAIAHKSFYRGLICLMLFLQIFQYGKWLIFAETNQYEFSTKIGKQLPQNAVIAGGWSTGLTIENELRPIVIQGKLDYNTKLINKIVKNRAVKSYSRRNGVSKSHLNSESNIPLFLAVSSNGEFDGLIREKYKLHIIPENLVLTQRLGYYDIFLYKMNLTK